MRTSTEPDVRVLLVMDEAVLGELQLLSRGFGQEQ
jgi:hypothetical protein